MKYSEKKVEQLSSSLIKLTTKNRNLSILVVFEPNIPFLYNQKGKNAEAKLITCWHNSHIVGQLPDGSSSEVCDSKDFIDMFVFLEFYLTQLLKLLIIDSFDFEQWVKLETLIGGKYLRLEDKKELIKSYNLVVWNEISANISPLQILRNSLAHSPVGPVFYKNELVNWEHVDKDINGSINRILSEYSKLQTPLLVMIKNL